MKKILLTAFLGMVVHFVSAQTQTGSWSVTGSAGYNQNSSQSSDNRSESENKAFEFKPSIGYFVVDNLEIGIAGGYNYSEFTTINSHPAGATSSIIYKVNGYSAGVYAKGYKFLLNNLALFGQADLNYNTADISSVQKQSSFYLYERHIDTDTDSYSASLRPGISFFASERVSLNATYGALSYSKNTDDHWISGSNESYGFTNESYRLGLDLSSSSFGLGLSFYF